MTTTHARKNTVNKNEEGRGLCDGLITRPEEFYWCGASSCVM